MRLRGNQLDAINAALKNGTAEDFNAALQKTCAQAESIGQFAAAPGSALTDAKKIQKAIELLQWMHDNCLAPDITAHDAVNTCRICRLIAELKAPNEKADLPTTEARGPRSGTEGAIGG